MARLVPRHQMTNAARLPLSRAVGTLITLPAEEEEEEKEEEEKEKNKEEKLRRKNLHYQSLPTGE